MTSRHRGGRPPLEGEKMRVAGVDEAGRGPLAGPVVAAAVILEEGGFIHGIGDSKALSPKMRRDLYLRIQQEALDIGIGIVGPEEIDRMNILKASLHAMRKAVLALSEPPDLVLVDGPYKIPLELPQVCLLRGDARSHLVGAASIVAKVTRDFIMENLHRSYPQYGFNAHKGYPTRQHREALRAYGPSPVHRLSFKFA